MSNFWFFGVGGRVVMVEKSTYKLPKKEPGCKFADVKKDF